MDAYRDRFLNRKVSASVIAKAVSTALSLDHSKVRVEAATSNAPPVDFAITPVYCRIHQLDGDFPTYLEVEILAGDYDYQGFLFEERLSEILKCSILVPPITTALNPYAYVLIEGANPHRVVQVDPRLLDREDYELKIVDYLD